MNPEELRRYICKNFQDFWNPGLKALLVLYVHSRGVVRSSGHPGRSAASTAAPAKTLVHTTAPPWRSMVEHDAIQSYISLEQMTVLQQKA